MTSSHRLRKSPNSRPTHRPTHYIQSFNFVLYTGRSQIFPCTFISWIAYSELTCIQECTCVSEDFVLCNEKISKFHMAPWHHEQYWFGCNFLFVYNSTKVYPTEPQRSNRTLFMHRPGCIPSEVQNLTCSALIPGQDCSTGPIWHTDAGQTHWTWSPGRLVHARGSIASH